MENTIVLLTVKDIVRDYKLSQYEVREILRSKGCPLIRGGNGRKNLIEKTAFENFIKERQSALSVKRR